MHKDCGTDKANTAENSVCEADGAFSAYVGSSDGTNRFEWLIDSGASCHMTKDSGWLICYREFEVPETVGLGDGRVVEAVGVGNVRLEMLFRGGKKPKTATVLLSLTGAIAGSSGGASFGATGAMPRLFFQFNV